MRVLELYAGIGGFSQCWAEAEVVAAIDIDLDARRIFQLNSRAPYFTVELGSVSRDWLQRFQADVWWMSPPCRPFSVRGKQADLDDPRASSLLHLAKHSLDIQPHWIVIENVPGFETSRTFEMLCSGWREVGYEIRHRLLCPSELGWPNLRRRVYAIISKSPPIDWQLLPNYVLSLKDLLEVNMDEMTRRKLKLQHSKGQDLRQDELAKLDRVLPESATSRAACFASSYGKMLVGSGSYLIESNGLRFFSPREVARILGFPGSFRFDEKMDNRILWRLLGNSLSLPCVRYILSHLPTGPTKVLSWATTS